MKKKASISDKIASSFGASLDWYDFALYGFFAPVFAKLFFPASSHFLSIALSYSAWFAGFFARSLGAIIFGYIGNKYGRRKCFQTVSLYIMFPAILLPLLPTYNSVGVIAPILLLVMRCIQGFCIGAEFAGNIVYLYETSNQKNGYFVTSLGSCTGSFGIMLASFVSYLVHEFLNAAEIESYGWRIAFLTASAASVISLWMRRNIAESPFFESVAKQTDKFSYLAEIIKEKGKILLSLAILVYPAAMFYFCFVFLPVYTKEYLKLDIKDGLANNSLMLALRLFLIPMIGIIADKIGGRKILFFSASLGLATFYIVLQSLGTTHSYISWVLIMLLSAMNAAVLPGILIKYLSPETRFLSMSLIFNIGFGIVGGIVPLLSVSTIEFTQNNLSPVLFIWPTMMITMWALWKIRNIKE